MSVVQCGFLGLTDNSRTTPSSIGSVHSHITKETDRQIDRQTDRQTDRQRDRQTDRHTNRQTDRQI